MILFELEVRAPLAMTYLLELEVRDSR